MILTVYRIGAQFSFHDAPDADEITLSVPDGSEVLPLGTLGDLVWVPASRRTRTWYTPQQLYREAMFGSERIACVEVIDGRSRMLRRRIGELRKELTVRDTARRLGMSPTAVLRAEGKAV